MSSEEGGRGTFWDCTYQGPEGKMVKIRIRTNGTRGLSEWVASAESQGFTVLRVERVR
jgi:hypothetical protein